MIDSYLGNASLGAAGDEHDERGALFFDEEGDAGGVEAAGGAEVGGV